MSTADLFDENWPHTHGTPDGYDHGCKSGACPAGEQYGLSCKTARGLSRSDFKYQRMVRNGATVADVANEFGFVGTLSPAPAASKMPRPAAKTPKEKTIVDTPTPATARGGRSIAATPKPETNTVDQPAANISPQARREAIWADTGKRLSEMGALGMKSVEPAAVVVQPEPIEIQPEPVVTAEPDGASAVVNPPAADVAAPTTAEIRAWARGRGYELGNKGRISQHIRAHYDEAHRDGAPATLTEAIATNLATNTATADTGAAESDTPEPVVDTEPSEADTEATESGTTAPETDLPRPDWGHVALLQDLEAARALAVRLEQELAHATEQLATASVQIETARGEATTLTAEYLDEFSKVIALEERLERRTSERDTAEKQLRIAQSATTLALTKWGEERAANEASYEVILGQARTINSLTDQLASRPRTISDQRYTYDPAPDLVDEEDLRRQFGLPPLTPAVENEPTIVYTDAEPPATASAPITTRRPSWLRR